MLGSLITYLQYISLILAVILPVMYLIKRYPDISFWFMLNIFFDPGGYLTYHLEGKLFSSLYISDIVILPILFCVYTVNTGNKLVYRDRFLMSFLKVFLIFTVYFFVVYGGIIPSLNNDLDYLVFLQKNRRFFYYIIILLSAYIFAMRGLKYFYFTTIFVGLIILTLFLITIATGIDLIPIIVMERYEGSDMMRLFIHSWGLFSILFPVSFILFLFSDKFKSNIKYTKLAHIGGVLMVFTLLVALSRRNFITMPGTILIIILLHSYIFRKSKVFTFTKILVPLSITLMVVNLTLPKYIDHIGSITQDTFQLLVMGKDTRGEEEYRVSGTGDLEITKQYIADNLFFGTGYNYLHWNADEVAVSTRGPVYAAAMDAAGEVPIYYIFFGYGLTGFLIMIFLYSYLVRLFLRLFALAKKRINSLTEYGYEVLFIFFILYWLAEKFTFSFWGLGNDFTSPGSAIFIGIGFALLQKMKIVTSNKPELLPSNGVNIPKEMYESN